MKEVEGKRTEGRGEEKGDVNENTRIEREKWSEERR